jgi:hypothetical protein
MESDRVSKKVKTSSSSFCLELCVAFEKAPVLYLLSMDVTRHILLDRNWCFIRDYSLFPESLVAKFRLFYECRNPPYFYGKIQQAREKLAPEIFDALYECYRPVRKWEDFARFGEMPPDYIINKLSSNDFYDLHMNYNIESDQAYLDLVTRIMLRFLRNQYFIRELNSKRLIQPTDTNVLARILVWKGYCTPDQPQYVVFSHLFAKEKESLILLAMARNRPAGESVFAQLPKDVLFRLIFPWIKWSLPFDV